MKIALFFVEYSNIEDIIDLISQIEDNNISFYVWCNGRSDKSKELERFANVYYSQDNIGYINPFIILSKKIWNLNYDFHILANSDIKIDNLFFKTLTNIKFDKTIGAIAPAIYLPSGRNQNPNALNRPSNAKIKLFLFMYRYKQVYSLLMFIRSIKNKYKNNIKDKTPPVTNIYSMHGCFMVFTRNSKLNSWDSFGAFLQDEELYVAEELRIRKLKTIYHEDLKIWHFEHRVTGRFKLEVYRKWHFKSMTFLWNKYFKTT